MHVVRDLSLAIVKKPNRQWVDEGFHSRFPWGRTKERGFICLMH
jgi:hypothetical protein